MKMNLPNRRIAGDYVRVCALLVRGKERISALRGFHVCEGGVRIRVRNRHACRSQ